MASAGGTNILVSVEPIPGNAQPDTSSDWQEDPPSLDNEQCLWDSTTAGTAGTAGGGETDDTERAVISEGLASQQGSDSGPAAGLHRHHISEQSPGASDVADDSWQDEDAAPLEAMRHEGSSQQPDGQLAVSSGRQVVGETRADQTQLPESDLKEHSRAGSEPDTRDHPARKEASDRAGSQLGGSPTLNLQAVQDRPEARGATGVEQQSTLQTHSGNPRQQESSSKDPTALGGKDPLPAGSVQHSDVGEATSSIAAASMTVLGRFAAVISEAKRRHAVALAEAMRVGRREALRPKQHDARDPQPVRLELIIPPQVSCPPSAVCL